MDASASLLIGEILRRNAQGVGGRAAASLGGQVLTHAALDAAGERVGHALRARGVAHGDRVLSWCDTSLEVFALFAATSKLGAVFAPLDGRHSPEEATPVARLARPRLIAADAAHLDRAVALARAVGAEAVPLGRLEGERDAGTLLGAPARAGRLVEPALRETDPHVIFFTSGSTGRPKGVVLSHRANYLRSFQGVFRDVPELSVCMFPLFHMAPFTLALSAWQTRGELILVRSASAEEILEATAARRANRLYLIPSIWHRILEADTGRYDTASLRELDTGTSATPVELIRAMKERFPGRVTRIYYGSTEIGSAASLPDVDVLRKPGSVGPASPGADLAISEAGEVLSRSAYLTDGYFDDAEATAAALRDGWFHTGDLGELDDEGYLSIVGRMQDLIRTGGESVAPAEVEAALAGHPSVAELAVVGIPDLRWGEIVCAVVVLAPGRRLDLADLQKHCEGRLAPFKKPRRLEFVDALPRTPATRQVQRALLVQRIAARPVS